MIAAELVAVGAFFSLFQVLLAAVDLSELVATSSQH